jgi:hypothetical protein
MCPKSPDVDYPRAYPPGSASPKVASATRQPKTGFYQSKRTQISHNTIIINRLKESSSRAGVCINQRRIKKHAFLTKQSHHVVVRRHINDFAYPNLSQIKPILSQFSAVLGYFRVIFWVCFRVDKLAGVAHHSWWDFRSAGSFPSGSPPTAGMTMR